MKPNEDFATIDAHDFYLRHRDEVVDVIFKHVFLRYPEAHTAEVTATIAAVAVSLWYGYHESIAAQARAAFSEAEAARVLEAASETLHDMVRSAHADVVGSFFGRGTLQ
jgi:hypothetical protein